MFLKGKVLSSVIKAIMLKTFFNRNKRLFETVVFIISIICVLSNIWFIFQSLKTVYNCLNILSKGREISEEEKNVSTEN